jgi:hypothetical protein
VKPGRAGDANLNAIDWIVSDGRERWIGAQVRDLRAVSRGVAPQSMRLRFRAAEHHQASSRRAFGRDRAEREDAQWISWVVGRTL